MTKLISLDDIPKSILEPLYQYICNQPKHQGLLGFMVETSSALGDNIRNNLQKLSGNHNKAIDPFEQCKQKVDLYLILLLTIGGVLIKTYFGTKDNFNKLIKKITDNPATFALMGALIPIITSLAEHETPFGKFVKNLSKSFNLLPNESKTESNKHSTGEENKQLETSDAIGQTKDNIIDH